METPWRYNVTTGMFHLKCLNAGHGPGDPENLAGSFFAAPVWVGRLNSPSYAVILLASALLCNY